MESESFPRLLELASKYGYPFLFLISAAENTFLLGLVVPGDVAVVLGGALSATGDLRPVTVTLVVIAGVLLGANGSFWIGRRGGVPLVERSAARFAVEPKRIQQVESYFERHGAKTVFLASFVSGVKNLVPVIAGASKMGAPRFFVYSAAGSAIRGALLVAIGYAFGANFPHALQKIGSMNGWILVAIVLVLVATAAVGWRKRRQSAQKGGGEGEDRVDRGASP